MNGNKGIGDSAAARKVYPDHTPAAADLEPGANVVIWRYTETRRDGDVVIPLPCHETQAVVWRPAPHLSLHLVVACRTCTRGFDVGMQADNDGGWYALFTMGATPILLSRGGR